MTHIENFQMNDQFDKDSINSGLWQTEGRTPLFEVKVGKGNIRISQMRYDAIEFDPIAARLISNILLK